MNSSSTLSASLYSGVPSSADRNRVGRRRDHEEVRRRKLLRVADDDELPAARDRADRVLRRKLRRLVEDHEVERRLAAREILRDRQWAHQKARLDRANRGLGVTQRLPQRAVIALLRHLALQERQRLARLRILQSLLRAIAKARRERRLVLRQHLAVEPAKLRDALLVRERVEARERRASLNDLRQPLHVERAEERVRQHVERHRAAHRIVEQLRRDARRRPSVARSRTPPTAVPPRHSPTSASARCCSSSNGAADR